MRWAVGPCLALNMLSVSAAAGQSRLPQAAAQLCNAPLGATLLQAKSGLIDAQAAAVDKAKSAAKAADGYVHENPWKSIGVAAGVGLLIGMLIGRR